MNICCGRWSYCDLRYLHNVPSANYFGQRMLMNYQRPFVVVQLTSFHKYFQHVDKGDAYPLCEKHKAISTFSLLPLYYLAVDLYGQAGAPLPVLPTSKSKVTLPLPVCSLILRSYGLTSLLSPVFLSPICCFPLRPSAHPNSNGYRISTIIHSMSDLTDDAGIFIAD